MTPRKPHRSIPILFLAPTLLGATMLAGFAAGCGVEVRPRMPTLHARATVAPATFTAEPAPAQGYAAGAPAGQAQSAPQGGYAAMPDDVATVGQYQQSGGATKETAEVVTIGSTLIGRVAKGAPRYYVIDLAVGDTFDLKAYMKPLLKSGSGTFKLKVFEPDDVRLGGITSYTYDETEWERKQTGMTAQQPGQHLVEVSADATIEYKYLINGNVLTE